jgi:UPF0755 protein
MVLGACAGWLFTLLCILLVWSRLSGPGSGQRVVVSWDLSAPNTAAENLARVGVIRSPWLFRWYLRTLRPTLLILSGEHLLNDALSPREVADRLGRTSARTRVRARFPEGFNTRQIGGRLEELEICTNQAFQRLTHDQSALAEFRVSGESLEGYLFPASYDLPVDSEPKAVAAAMVRELNKRLERLQGRHPAAFAALYREFQFGPREVLTLASMIEKETGVAEERPLIASVLYNRLRSPSFTPNRMLQSDPTAAYGCLVEPDLAPSCQGFHGRVSPAMLRDTQNRYNTYRHQGLPPGPIGNPGELAIEAALVPATTDLLFFVASGNGRHTFSRTFDEHARAVRQLSGGVSGGASGPLVPAR